MRIKRFKSLAFKLTVWYIVILGILVVLAGLFLYQGFKETLMDDLDKVLLEIADETYETWGRKRGVTWEDAIQKAESKFSSYSPYIQLVQIEEHDKKRIKRIIRSNRIPEEAFQLSTHIYYRADKTDIDDLIFSNIEEKHLISHPLRIILMPIRGPNILQVGISLEDASGALNQLLFVMVVAGFMLLLLASLGGSFIINKALHPVKNAVNTARKITADDLSLRIEAKTRNDEIGALIETFNDMIVRLEKSVKKIRQFSGDVSHELRTPLTIIRGEIEVLMRKDRAKEEYVKILNSVLEESYRLEKVIDDLLFLSRIEAIDKSRLNEIVQMEEVVEYAVDSRRQSASNKDIEITAENVMPSEVRGNRNFLERMVTNVLDNAIRYTSSGGRVEVVLDKVQSTIQLEVRDTGIGIPDESLPYIFDRFFVVDKSRSKETGGSGLGLSIVKWIADSHGAEIEVQSQEDKGTTFLIKFPLVWTQ